MTTSGIRNFIISLVAVAAVVFLTVSVFIMSGKAGKAGDKAAAAEEAAAAYASALAESTAKMNEAVLEKQDLEMRAAAAGKEKETLNTDFSGEAELYSDFISGDGSIRSALSALSGTHKELPDKGGSPEYGGREDKRERGQESTL